ncbi:MAG: HAMP domain-containing histidine kinase [Polyangiaceae bacterium]|nr:HAMP domain-containing histidine kinase [Polyangiaceae bacterium]
MTTTSELPPSLGTEVEASSSFSRGSLSEWARGRWAVLFVAFLAALPGPWSRLWGGNRGWTLENLSLPCAIFVSWIVFQVILAFQGARFSSESRSWLLGSELLLDVLAITALLGCARAANNPFTLLYFVPIVFATLISRRWTILVAIAAVIGFGVLLLITSSQLPQGMHHGHLFQHVQGMAIALAVAGALLTYFMHQIAAQLRVQRERIQKLSQQHARDRATVALGALAAGAAHELGSPLTTIQLLADDLCAMESGEQERALHEIRRELSRAKEIVHQLSSSELSAHHLMQLEEHQFLELAQEFKLALTSQEKCHFSSAGRGEVFVPRHILEQVARELVHNARKADPESTIKVSLALSQQELVLSVADDGPGMKEELLAAASEPFVSFSGGKGLGLFLADVQARQLQGRLEVQSREGEGTMVTFSLPSDCRLVMGQRGQG